MSLTERINKIREQREMTLEEFAFASGLGMEKTLEIESGRADVKAKDIKNIAKALDVTPDFLMGWSEDSDEIEDLGKIKKDRDSKNRLTVKEAAELMGASEQYIRIGLQRNMFDWGYAIKMSSKYSYYISKQKFEQAMGISVN